MHHETMTTCPDEPRLRRYLRDALPEEEAEFIAHLDHCENCQQALEVLAAGGERLLHTAREIGAETPTCDAGLRQIVDQLAKADIRSGTTLPPEDIRGFLDPPDEPGQLGRLGHYAVLDVIGRGGMGIVLKAFDRQLQRVVAIKVLAPRLSINAAARARFLREARAAAAIRDDHVIDIYAVEESVDLPYLVMEYIAGPSLEEQLKRSGPLEAKEILRIGMQTALGLAAAHAQGVIHRDVKPANILLENGVRRVKLTDFGLACAADDAAGTHQGLIAGTPPYMAPEQARGEAVDPRTDLFSLGSVLYALCTGQGPFHGDTTIVLQEVKIGRPRPVREMNPHVPEALAAVIAKLHAPNPADRYASAAEVAEVLRRQLAHLDTPMRDPSVRRRLVLACAGAFMVIALALVAWSRWPGDPSGSNANGTDAGKQFSAPPPPLPKGLPRVLFVLPTDGFFYPDYMTVRNGLEKRGMRIVVAAPTKEPAQPLPLNPQHQPVTPNVLLKDAKVADFNAIYLCGGKGVEEFLEDGPHAAAARRLIADALAAQRLVAALGMGPNILADAGVLKGVRATCFQWGQPRDIHVERLKGAGAIWVDEPVVVSRWIITGRNPDDVFEFTEEFAKQIDLQIHLQK